MALDFPSSPTNGQTYGNYYYDSTVGAWNSFSSTVNTVPSTLKNLTVTTDDVGVTPFTVKSLAGTTVVSINDSGTISANTLSLTNVLTVANGGTGAGTFTTGSYLKGNGTSAIQAQTGIPFSDVTMIEIPAAADLNTYTTQGLYHQSQNTEAAGGTNYPVALAGLLQVYQSGVDGNGFTYQTYSVYQGAPAIWSRTKYNTTWSAWKQVPMGTVTVAQGGTGATTAPTALSNLGAAPLAGASFTGSVQSIYGGTGLRLNLSNTQAGSDQYLNAINLSNDTGYKVIHFLNSSTRTVDGGANAYTIRNDYGSLMLGHPSYDTTISGKVLRPNQPSFLARNNEYINSTRNIVFAEVLHNNGNYYNSTNGRFTAPVLGYYLFNFQTLIYDMGTSSSCWFQVNGTTNYLFAGTYGQFSGSYAGQGSSAVLYLNANDYVTIYFGYGTTKLHAGYTTFSGHLLS